MMMNRREFAKGGLAALGFLALDGLPVFAAPVGWKPKKKPNLVLGILSDTHLMVEWDGKSLYRTMTLDYVRNAFNLFKERNVDAFLHLGDAAHRAADRELEFHRELFEEVFGKSGGPVKLLVPGNHEWFDCRDMHQKIWANDWQEHALICDFPRLWGRAWGVTFEEMWHKEVNGYHFFGRDWNVDEIKFADFILSNAKSCGLKGKKPFFVLSHRRHHFGFCHALREYPNAVAFFGHWHQSNADYKTIYYDSFGGFFPSIEVGACRFDGGNALDVGHESVLKEKFATSGEIGELKEQDWHSNKVPSRQAMVVNIYDDFVMFERHEVGQGGKLGPDWVLPLKWREKKDANGEPFKHPFSHDMLSRRIGSPKFPPKAKLEIGKMGDALNLTIPLADGNPKSRVFAYDVVVIGDNPAKKFFKSAYFEGVNLGIGHEPDGGITKVELPMAELPAGKNLTIAVRPISSLGTKGKAIATKFKA
jgi:predicted phosphodiesterase